MSVELVSSYRLSIVTMQRFGRNLHASIWGRGQYPCLHGKGEGLQWRPYIFYSLLIVTIQPIQFGRNVPYKFWGVGTPILGEQVSVWGRQRHRQIGRW